MKSLFLSRGRAGRKAYWLTSLALVAAEVVVCAIAAAVIMATSETGADGTVTHFSGAAIAATVVAVVLQPLFVWAFVVIAIKRCHDHDRSGVFLFLNFVPLANTWLFVEQSFVPGTTGLNQHGPDPVPRWTAPLVKSA